MIHIVVADPARDHALALEAEIFAASDATGPELTTEHTHIERRITRLFELCVQGDYWIYTALDDDDPIGMVFVDRIDTPGSGLYIDNLFVKVSQRRRGVGRRLLMTVHALANDVGEHHVELMVTADNRAAILLYEALGYRIQRHRMRVECSVDTNPQHPPPQPDKARAKALLHAFDWAACDEVIAAQGVTLDRPRKSTHPVHKDIVYPIDYGYVNGTIGEDGAEVDIFVGRSRQKLGI